MKKIQIILLTIFASFLLFTNNVSADSISCSNRYLTLVNPVRGRSLWSDKTLKPLFSQSLAAQKYGFPVTWLLQYDALTDQEVTNTIKGFSKDELGLFLEISKTLADESGVNYPENLKWSNPGAVFLSAYSQSERRLLIDTLYSKFKNVFGYYPKSVGAWWIDSYSLNYIKQKYGLSTILIVADQKTTDSYGVWGQWWGYPYFPSKYNVLIPGDQRNSLGSVVIQWAQRDPVKAYGEGPGNSNFSLQANDYIRNGQNTDYFESLVSSYLDCQNPLGQITIGMETGMEAVGFQSEYENQLKYLSSLSSLKTVTMSSFAERYKSVYKNSFPTIKIGDWSLNLQNRENSSLGDTVNYNTGVSFADYFLSDKSNFLDRTLPVAGPKSSGSYFPWFLITIIILGIYSCVKKHKMVFATSLLFVMTAFSLIFRSQVIFGWRIFYGPVLNNISLIQAILPVIVFSVLLFPYSKLKKRHKDINLLMCLLPLSFGLDRILSFLRYSKSGGIYFFGILIERIHLIGITFGNHSFTFLNEKLSIGGALSLSKFPFDKVWRNTTFYIVFYSLAHIFLAIIIYLLVRKLPSKVKIAIVSVLSIFFIAYLFWIFGFDPRVILPVTN